MSDDFLPKRYMKYAAKDPLLTKEEELKLIISFKDPSNPSKNVDLSTNRQALKQRNILISKNLRLVISIAKRYKNRGIPLQDLVQEGNVGLIKAANKFDPTRGVKYATYASYWVKQAITRALAEHKRLIRIPVYLTEDLTKISKAYSILQDKNIQVSPENISKYSGVDLVRIQRLYSACSDILSLDKEVDGVLALKDMLADKNVKTKHEPGAVRLARALINKFEDMPSIYRETICLRRGLFSRPKFYLYEIADVMGSTIDQIKEIDVYGLRLLRSNYIIKNSSEKSSESTL